MTDTTNKKIPSVPIIRFWPGNKAQPKIVEGIKGVDKLVPSRDHYIIYATSGPLAIKAKLERALNAMEDGND